MQRLGSLLADEEPAISQNGGTAGRHLLVWKSVSTFSASEAVKAQLLDTSANPVGAPLEVATPGSVDRPDADGDGTEFLVVFQTPESASASRRDIEGRKVRFDGTRLLVSSPVLSIESDSGDDEVEPSVVLLGPKYLVLWGDEVGGLNYDIGGIVLRRDDCRRCGREFAITDLNLPRQSGPRIASRLAVGDNADDCLLVWQEAGTTPPFSGNVVRQRFEAQGGRPPALVGPGCPGGGLARTAGDFTPGSPDFAFEVTQADPATVIFALSLGFPGPGSTCGSCDFLQPVALSFVLPSGPGSASFSFEPSCDPAFLGFVLDFQWIAFGAGDAPCPAAAGVAASSRLRVTLVE